MRDTPTRLRDYIILYDTEAIPINKRDTHTQRKMQTQIIEYLRSHGVTDIEVNSVNKRSEPVIRTGLVVK